MSKEERRAIVDRQPVDERSPSITRQCQLLSISRSSLYYQPAATSDEDLSLMKSIDRQYLLTPFYGARRMAAWLRTQNHEINRKHVGRLMRVMGLNAIYRRPRTSKPTVGHKIYPYLLRGVAVTRPHQVWTADITYVPMAHGFLYLVVIMDWYSRYVLSWRLSNTLESDFCVEALKEALQQGRPEIFNTDQGAQFTGEAFIGLLEQHGIQISMDGKGSYTDNLFIERLWRTVKYEEIYLKAYHDGKDARNGLAEYFRFYNNDRLHQAHGYRTPADIFSNMVESLTSGTIAEHDLSLAPILSN